MCLWNVPSAWRQWHEDESSPIIENPGETTLGHSVVQILPRCGFQEGRLEPRIVGVVAGVARGTFCEMKAAHVRKHVCWIIIGLLEHE